MRCGAEITFHDISRLTGRFLLRYADILGVRLAYARRAKGIVNAPTVTLVGSKSDAERSADDAAHREVLALRGLAMRGYLAPRGTRRTRRTQQWEAAVAFLARHGDNGVVWNVPSFWRATK